MKRAHPVVSFDSWLKRVAPTVDGEHLDAGVIDAAGDLAETLTGRPDGIDAALHRFGSSLGADGWPIAQVSLWVREMGECTDRAGRRLLTQFSALSSLARGWADGYVRGAHSSLCTDPTTGLVTAMVLRTRLQEVYEQSRSVGLDPAEHHALVIVDVDLHDDEFRELPRLDADLRMVCVADSVCAVFQRGETIARADHRILVLVALTEYTDQWVDILTDRLQTGVATSAAHATVMLETLPDDVAMLDRYVRDLVS
ncbi:MAG: hypothetical protein Q8M22_07450 [Actinomycetota bacterium]|nr:hypothetical protein [Actinomycetota bacterium]